VRSESRARRDFSGAFIPHDGNDGTWRLSRSAPHQADVFLRGAEHGAAEAFAGKPVTELGIEWHAQHALLTFVSGAKAASVRAASAIVHEPLESLYAGLPLASIDADARRFWQRVFWLVRLPGGRHLLKLLRRSRHR
jgi:hypothetical protein